MCNCRTMTTEELIEENNRLINEISCLKVKVEAFEENTRISGFKEAMAPAIKWFKENCNPHQRIIIEADGVELVSGEMAFPVEAMG